MDETRLWEILDTPPELRTPEEVAALNRWLGAAPDVAAAADTREAAFAAFSEAFAEEPPEGALRRLEARLAADRPSLLQRIRAWFGGWQVVVPTLAMASLTVVLLSRLAGGGPDTGITTKGAGGALLGVDLQVSREHGAEDVEPANDRVVLGPDDGLIFRFQTYGAPYLALIERDPDHNLRVLYQWEADGEAPRAPVTVAITADDGAPLRYSPDGRPGEYTYLAWISDEPLEDDAEALDAIWQLWVREVMHGVRDGDPHLDGIRVRHLPNGTPIPSWPGEEGR